MNADLLNFADMLDAMEDGETMDTATLSITRSNTVYHVEPPVNGCSYLSFMEVIDYVKAAA